MNRRIASILMTIVAGWAAFGISAQEKAVKMPTEHREDVRYRDYTEMDQGFFCAAEVAAAWLFDRVQKPFVPEFDFVGGYRFNDFVRVGIGLGVRYYDNADDVRFASSRFGMPLYLNIRGNIIPSDYRDVVPYYSFDLGTSFPDGLMFRPTFGLRIGQNRSAFLVGISYLGQTVRFAEIGKRHKFMSGVSIRLGYEF